MVHEKAPTRTKCGMAARTAAVRLTYLTDRCARSHAKPRPQAAKTATAYRHRVAVGEFDDAVVAGAFQAHHAIDVDDMAAMHPHETGAVEPRLDVADRQGAEKLGAAVKYIGVVRIGMDGDHVLHGNEMGGAVALDGQAARARCGWLGGRTGAVHGCRRGLDAADRR